jgi:NADH-quinone oxidoreductase subunit C
MDFSKHFKIVALIEETLGSDIIVFNSSNEIQPYLEVKTDSIVKVCHFLKTHEKLYFDFLNCISAVDNGFEVNTIDIWYHLTSIVFEHSFILKLTLPREQKGENVPSISSVWKTADWHERETYDLLGVNFIGHPDLRRILLPADWEGFPLRKDYLEQEKYHGINVKYDR